MWVSANWTESITVIGVSLVSVSIVCRSPSVQEEASQTIGSSPFRVAMRSAASVLRFIVA